jgi:hypothetical protein
LKQLEYKVDHEIKDMLANVEHSKASQISHKMHNTPEPDWLHTIEEDGVAYYTECSGEQNLYRLTMSGSLIQVGSYKRERDDDGYKVRVMTFLAEPVVATEPAPAVVEEPTPPTPTPPPSPTPPLSPASLPPPSPPQPSSLHVSSSPSTPHYADKCPLDETQILMSITYKNDFKNVNNEKLSAKLLNDNKVWKHFVHEYDYLDSQTTFLRVVIAKYNKNIESPTIDDISYEIHYHKLWKVGSKKRLQLNGKNSSGSPCENSGSACSPHTDSSRRMTSPFTVAEFEHSSRTNT